MDSFNYTTIEGDRIDNLAHRFYGGMHGIAILSEANPFVQLEAIFPTGTILIIPIIETTPIIENQNLPPWKKSMQ